MEACCDDTTKSGESSEIEVVVVSSLCRVPLAVLSTNSIEMLGARLLLLPSVPSCRTPISAWVRCSNSTMRTTVASCMHKQMVKVKKNGPNPECDSLTGSARIPVPKIVATATKVALIKANVSRGRFKRAKHWECHGWEMCGVEEAELPSSSSSSGVNMGLDLGAGARALDPLSAVMESDGLAEVRSQSVESNL